MKVFLGIPVADWRLPELSYPSIQITPNETLKNQILGYALELRKRA